MNTARAYVMNSADAPAFWQLGDLWRLMASGVQTGGSFAALDQLVVTGGGPPTHMHPQDEGLYVVKGHCTFQAGGKTLAAGTGQFVSIPRFTEHSFNIDEPDTQVLNFYTPAGFEMLLMGTALPAERNELPPKDVPMPPRRLVEQLSRDYGQIPVRGLPFADPPTAENQVTVPTPGATVFPFLTDAREAPAYWSVGGLWTLLADGASTGGSYCLFEETMPKGPAAPPHLHEDMDEVFYMLDGEAEFFLEDRREVAREGAMVFIPRGSVHAFRVNSDSSRFLNLYTGAGFERTITEMGQATNVRTLPPQDWKPPEIPQERMTRLFAEIGMRPVAVPDPFRE
jgi:quercetin dioxygenase-like cupin family protein